jgi:hypothetical protein
MPLIIEKDALVRLIFNPYSLHEQLNPQPCANPAAVADALAVKLALAAMFG